MTKVRMDVDRQLSALAAGAPGLHAPPSRRPRRHRRLPDARPGLDPLRGARLARASRRRWTKLCPTCTVDLPERQCRRRAAAAAVQLGAGAGREGRRARPGRLPPPPLRWCSMAHDQGVKVIAYDRPIPDSRPTTTCPSTTRASARPSRRSLVDHLKAEGVPDGVRRAADQRLAHRRGGRA